MDSSSQIDTVQKFSEVIGDHDDLWNLLVGREVSRFDNKLEYEHSRKDIQGVTFYQQGKVIEIKYLRTSKFLLRVDYGSGFIFKYSKKQFIRKFNQIVPSIIWDEVLKLTPGVRWEETKIGKKLSLLQNIKDEFENNFLNADNFYQLHCTEYVSSEEYKSEKFKYIQNWINTKPDLKPCDPDQAKAIGTLANHVQVIARAGSGKTSTLVNRAIFSQKHCGIAPGEMLLLAFNRKAADEMGEKMQKGLSLPLQSQNSVPHAMTFHALAYALVHPNRDGILFNELDGEQRKSRALQSEIDKYLRHPIFSAKIRDLMMAAFREDWERIISGGYDKIPEEMLRYRRSLIRKGIDGQDYKSYGEKLIANFLFEHNIKYKYGRKFRSNDINERPSFTIFTGEEQNIVIEYLEIEGEPGYNGISNERQEYLQQRPTWQFIESSPKTLKYQVSYQGIEVFCALLKDYFEEDLGISCQHLSEEQIWLKIKDRAIDRFTTLVEGFVQRCRKFSLTSDKLAAIIDKHQCISNIEEQFLNLAKTFYQSYLQRLEVTGEEDFDGLMQKAIEVVASGQTIFRRKSRFCDLKSLRYIMIDEYQDFSELFYKLIAAIRKQNPQALFFCVGDDWQAINGFAGSDLRFYQNFHQFFQPSQQLNISTNYRSATSIVDIGNKLMQGLGTPARAHKTTSGIVNIADMSSFKPTPTEQENYPGDNITPAILRLINKTLKEGKEVVLLSRKNSLPWDVNYTRLQSRTQNSTLPRFLKLVHSCLPEASKKLVTISTAHKYKGSEKKVVIILDAVSSCYPLIHPNIMFTRVLGDSIESVVNEDRRLFYVALTRAVETLFIVTESKNPSPFLEELNSRTEISVLNWSDYQPFIGVGNTRYITVKVGNQDGKGSNGTYTIRDLLKAEGYRWNKTKIWYRTYPVEGFSVPEYFNNANWISQAVGIEVQFYDDGENKSEVYRVNQGQYYLVNENDE